jgi:hypothetical protein
LSYQPPGNGWNNQRIAIETAFLLAKMLHRTLILHPLSSHRASERMKLNLPHSRHFGYLTYNKMKKSDLLSISNILDLTVMSKGVSVVEFNNTHTRFMKEYSNCTWTKICHSMGYGYWMDRHPETIQQKQFLSKQLFVPNESWKSKCSQEAKSKIPVVKYVSDLLNDTSDIIYFEEGTLFGIQIRFTTLEATMAAQESIKGHIQYIQRMYSLADAVGQSLGKYNAIHIRRVGHQARLLTPGAWIVEMLNMEFSTDMPVYVATDEVHLSWFDAIKEAGFKLYFAANFTNEYDFTKHSKQVRQDILGVQEQLVCVRAERFVPSLHSTFSTYILRERGEIEKRDGLYVNALHTTWIKHMIS